MLLLDQVNTEHLEGIEGNYHIYITHRLLTVDYCNINLGFMHTGICKAMIPYRDKLFEWETIKSPGHLG